MTGPTHRKFAVFFVYLLSIVYYRMNIINIYYYLALPIMLLVGQYAAKWCDYDHHKKSLPDKNFISKMFSKLIHLTGGKHRSWQTHSLDIAVWATVLAWVVPNELYKRQIVSIINREVMLILALSFCLGWLSHLFCDMLNGVGIRLFCWNKFTIAFVPMGIHIKIWKFTIINMRFNTGNAWEAFVYRTVGKINYVCGFISVTYPLIYNGYFDPVIKPVVKFIEQIV